MPLSHGSRHFFLAEILPKCSRLKIIESSEHDQERIQYFHCPYFMCYSLHKCTKHPKNETDDLHEKTLGGDN